MSSETLMFSEIFYLFAHEKIPTAGIIGLNDEHPAGKKLKSKHLAEQMVAAALAYLQFKNLISFDVRAVKKLLIMSSEKVYVNKLKVATDSMSGIENELFSRIQNNLELFSAIRGLLNTERFDPWGDIVLYSKNSLVVKNFLTTEEKKTLIFKSYKFTYNVGALEEAEKSKNLVESELQKFQVQPAFGLIYKTIAEAIKSREEKPDNDFD